MNAKRLVSGLLLSMSLAAPLASQSSVPDPIVTRPVETLGAGNWDFFLGAGAAGDAIPAPLLAAPIEGDLLQAPILRFAYGLGRIAQIEVEWPGWQWLDTHSAVNGGSIENSSELSDLRFWTQISFRHPDEHPRGPGLGLRIGLKAPNASDQEGLGTDETDLFASFLLQQGLGSSLLMLNLGLGVLGDPVQESEQVDVVTYGIALRVPVASSSHLYMEVAGWEDTISQREPGDLALARVGFGVPARSGRFVGSVGAGLSDLSPDWTVHLGYHWRSSH